MIDGFDTDIVENKIPYDDSPILRNNFVTRNSRGASSSYSSGKFSGTKNNTLVYIIMSIFAVIMVAFGSILYETYNYIKYVKQMGFNINNYNNFITPANDAAATANVVAKGKLSNVLVVAGTLGNGSTFTNYGITYDNFDRYATAGAGTIVEVNKETGVAYIITCAHVIVGYEAYVWVLLYDSVVPVHAEVIGANVTYDIAVLKIGEFSTDHAAEIRNSVCVAAEIGDSTTVYEGQSVVAIGNPLGLGSFSKTGTVSYYDITVAATNINGRNLIAVDIDINSGNSGGALYNNVGKMIGVVASMSNQKGGVIGFAVQSSVAISVAYNMIRNNGILLKPNLGINSLVFSDKQAVINESDGTLTMNYTMKVINGTNGFTQNDTLKSFTYYSIRTHQNVTVLFNKTCSLECHIFDMDISKDIKFTIERNSEEQEVNINVTTTSVVS